MTSLDDLLSQDDEGRAERSLAGRLVRRGLITGVLAAVLAGGLVLALHLLGYGLAYPLAFGGFFALLVLHRSIRALGVTRPGRLGGRPEPPVEESGPDGLALAAGRWQSRLAGGRGGGRTRAAVPMMAELVDERLRRRHGVTRGTDPAKARRLLGERLWAYLDDPAVRTPPPRELAAMLTSLEKL